MVELIKVQTTSLHEGSLGKTTEGHIQVYRMTDSLTNERPPDLHNQECKKVKVIGNTRKLKVSQTVGLK